MILALTSFGFGVCAFVACVCHDYVGCGLLIGLTSTSVLHHANGTDKRKYIGGSIVSSADHVLAHTICLRAMYETLPYGVIGVPVYMSILYVILVYYNCIHGSPVYHRGHKLIPWHASIHIVAQLGCLYGYGLKFSDPDYQRCVASCAC
jgi:hypothetical protein